MKPKNYLDRRKKILKFAASYTASVLLLFFLFSAFGNGEDKGNDAEQVADVQHGGDQQQQADINKIMSQHLSAIQLLDQGYAALLADSATTFELTELSGRIEYAELALQKSLDSITAKHSGVDNTMSDEYFNDLLSSFKTLASDRVSIEQLRATVNKSDIGSVKLMTPDDILQVKNELIQKEIRVMDLESELKAYRTQSRSPEPIGLLLNEIKAENVQLSNSLAEKEHIATELKAANHLLKSANENLVKKLGEKNAPVLNTSPQNNSSANTVALERKIKDLNAELYFTKVDCNLMRTDARQIIYNARQRKEILTESLSMLNTLARSNDEATQKRAREKLIYLNQIANTLRD